MPSELPGHDWLLSVLLPVTEREVARMADGQRRVFKVVIEHGGPVDGSVRGVGVFCGRCQLAAESMTPQEMVGCRGEVESV